MCRCGEAACAFCQAKWAAPAVLAAHRTGSALLPIAVTVADPSVAQHGIRVTSRLHAQLREARKGAAVTPEAGLLPWLSKHVQVHAPDLVLDDGVLRQSRPRPVTPGFRGVPVDALLAVKGGAARLAAAIAANELTILPGTDLVFDTATAVPRGGGGPVLVSALLAHNPNGRRGAAAAKPAGGH